MIQHTITKTILRTKRVQDRFKRAANRILTRFGSFLRRDVRTLLRRKGTKKNPVSKPGQPPFSPTGKLRNSIRFDADSESVVVGPTKLRAMSKPLSGTVASVLEEGGRIRIREMLYKGRWVKARGSASETRMRTVTIKPRPYMSVAYEKNKQLLLEWHNKLKG